MSILKLGEIIRRRREELGVSQEDLAYGICSVPTLSKVENGCPRRAEAAMVFTRLSLALKKIPAQGILAVSSEDGEVYTGRAHEFEGLTTQLRDILAKYE